MSGKTWVLEYTGLSIGYARDVAAQAAGPGRPVPNVSVAGRLGYEAVSTDYDMIRRLNGLVVIGGGRCYLTARDGTS